MSVSLFWFIMLIKLIPYQTRGILHFYYGRSEMRSFLFTKFVSLLSFLNLNESGLELVFFTKLVSLLSFLTKMNLVLELVFTKLVSLLSFQTNMNLV